MTQLGEEPEVDGWQPLFARWAGQGAATACWRAEGPSVMVLDVSLREALPRRLDEP